MAPHGRMIALAEGASGRQTVKMHALGSHTARSTSLQLPQQPPPPHQHHRPPPTARRCAKLTAHSSLAIINYCPHEPIGLFPETSLRCAGGRSRAHHSSPTIHHAHLIPPDLSWQKPCRAGSRRTCTGTALHWRLQTGTSITSASPANWHPDALETAKLGVVRRVSESRAVEHLHGERPPPRMTSRTRLFCRPLSPSPRLVASPFLPSPLDIAHSCSRTNPVLHEHALARCRWHFD
jgi:hypothetical protein